MRFCHTKNKILIFCHANSQKNEITSFTGVKNGNGTRFENLYLSIKI